MKHILILFSMVVLRCCWGPSNHQLMLDSQNQSSVLKDLNGKYNILKLNNEDVSSYNLNINFKKEMQQVSGFSGCNRFFGSYSQSENKLSFGQIGSTKMLCVDEKSNIEIVLLKAFQKANSIIFNGNGFSMFQNKKLLLIADKEETINKNISFEYSAFSRNLFQVIKVNSKSISVQKARKGNLTRITCTKEQWEKLLNSCKHVNFDNISNLKAPSEKRFFDGAAIAKLKVIVDGKTYETPSFDHGNPHPDIANLVKEILSLAQNIE